MYLFSSKELPWDTKSRLMNLNMLDQIPVQLSEKPKYHYHKKPKLKIHENCFVCQIIMHADNIKTYCLFLTGGVNRVETVE